MKLVDDRRQGLIGAPPLAAPLALAAGTPAVLLGGKKSIRDALRAARDSPLLTFAGPSYLFFYRAREKFRARAAANILGTPIRLARALTSAKPGQRMVVGEPELYDMPIDEHIARSFKDLAKDTSSRNEFVGKKYTVILISLDAYDDARPDATWPNVNSPVTCGALYDFLRERGWVAG
jgi:hypothetical protein